VGKFYGNQSTKKPVYQFEFEQITPKAFANFSPGFEEREPWVEE